MKEITFKNATICITRPTLTEAERAKRESAILTVLQQYGKAMHEIHTRK